MNKKNYDNDFKYEMIEELCNGKTSREIEREYGVKNQTVMKWLRYFIQNGTFGNDALSSKENIKLGQLKEKRLLNLLTGLLRRNFRLKMITEKSLLRQKLKTLLQNTYQTM